jgi:cell division protein FtsW
MGIAREAKLGTRAQAAREALLIKTTRHDRIRRWTGRLLLATALLAGGGLLTSFSTTVFLNISLDRPAYAGFLRHLAFIGAGSIVALVAVILINRLRPARRWLQIVIPLAFYASLILVLLVQVPGLGMEDNGARRFLNLGFIQFQPSELLKVSLVLYLGQLLCWWRLPAPEQQPATADRPRPEYDPRSDVELRGSLGTPVPRRGARSFRLTRDSHPVWPELPKRCMFIVLLALGLTAIQPDLGSTGIILGCSFLIFVIAGVRLRELLGFALLLICLITAGLAVTWAFDSDRYDYAAQRLSTWATSITQPAADEDGPAYQLAQARGALAVGGIWGRGYLNSDQKMNRLPLSTSDFVYPIIVEEFGFVGGLAVMLAFLYFAWTAMRLAFCCRNPFNRVVISALGFTICLQALVNISVTIGTLPLSGLTLPFFSAGGTSIFVSLIAVGLMCALGFSEIRERQPSAAQG